jgi:hypothetical protein
MYSFSEEALSCIPALLADLIILGFSFCRLLYKVLHVRHLCYLCSLFRFASSARTRNGSPGSSLSCDESVLCCTWLPGVECAAS